MLAKLSPELTPKDKSNYYYKKHSEHNGYDEVVAKARLAQASKEDEGKIPEAEVKQEESEEALLKEAEENKDQDDNGDNLDVIKEWYLGGTARRKGGLDLRSPTKYLTYVFPSVLYHCVF